MSYFHWLFHQIWIFCKAIAPELDKVAAVINLAIAVATVSLTLITAWLTLIILRLTAKPSIGVRMHKHHEFICGSEVDVVFSVYNKGRWYGHPPATGVRIYVNVPPAFLPIRLRYGSTLQKEDSDVKIGKGLQKYLRAKEIGLFFEEPGEDLVLSLRLPDSPGRFGLRLTANSEQGGYSVSRFKVRCIQRPVQGQRHSLPIANEVQKLAEERNETVALTLCQTPDPNRSTRIESGNHLLPSLKALVGIIMAVTAMFVLIGTRSDSESKRE